MLSNSNSYTGTTTVNGGTLKITGSHFGAGDYNVARLAGSTGQIILDNGASISSPTYLYIGTDGGNGTFSHVNGYVTTGSTGTPELYVGYKNGTGLYDLQAGSLSLPTNGYANIGRDGGTGTVNVASSGSLDVSQELRVGAEYANVDGSTGSVTNNGTVTAERIELGIVSTAGRTSTGTFTVGDNSSTTTTGPIQIGLTPVAPAISS